MRLHFDLQRDGGRRPLVSLLRRVEDLRLEAVVRRRVVDGQRAERLAAQPAVTPDLRQDERSDRRRSRGEPGNVHETGAATIRRLRVNESSTPV